MRIGTLLLTMLALLLMGSLTPGLLAQDDCPHPRKWASWQFQIENDFAAVASGSDEHYTNGLLYSRLRHPDCNPRWADRAAQRIEGLLSPGRPADTAFGFEVGQHIFTPADLSPFGLIPDDRPYASYVYGGLFFVLTDRDQRLQQLVELQFGLVGPEAGGEFFQTELHELIDDEPPNGWDNQLGNEPALNLIYLWRRRYGAENFDLVPHLGGALGNVQIYANAGLTLRAGWNISGFPVLQNRMTLESATRRQRSRSELYFFLGADGRAVAHNLFLDGNTFRDSHSVEKEDFVYDLKGGFSARFRSFRFTYTFVRRSREFFPLPAGTLDGGRHEFGSLSFAVERAF